MLRVEGEGIFEHGRSLRVPAFFRDKAAKAKEHFVGRGKQPERLTEEGCCGGAVSGRLLGDGDVCGEVK